MCQNGLPDWPRNMKLTIAHRFLPFIKRGITEDRWKKLSDMKEYHRRVLEAAAEGADFIKIMTTGLLDFADHGKITGTPLSATDVKEMVHIAHEEGFAVMSHTNGCYGVQAAVEAGVDSIEHGNYMDDETISMLADSESVWVPTLVTVRNLKGCGRFEDTILASIIKTGEQNLKKAFEKKVHVAVGSDAGAYQVLHGQGVQDESRAFLIYWVIRRQYEAGWKMEKKGSVPSSVTGLRI